jgi:electron transfer flavoprotein alpha subunit
MMERRRIERRRGADVPGPSGRIRRNPHARAAPAPTSDPATEPASERIRRDPRAEAAARNRRAAPSQEGPAVDAEITPTPATGRVRRDPRAEARARTEAPRLQPAATPAAGIGVIENPACLILAVPDLEDGALTSHDRDLLGAARKLADALQGAVVVLACTGPQAIDVDFGAAGADRLIVATDPRLAGYAPEARAAAVLAAIGTLDPRHVLLPDSGAQGGDVGRRVAAALGMVAGFQVQRLSPDDATSRGNGGRSDFAASPSRVLLIAPETADPVAGTRYEARLIEAPRFAAETRIADRGLAAIDANTVPLQEADFIVSAGNGVTDWSAFHEVAAALGATEGGSRVVCDAGHLPRGRQVGASGTLVEPRCYLAFGIAGAPQHLQGITRCERVVAINTDLHAEMIKRADLAIVADAQAVMPALARLARRLAPGDAPSPRPPDQVRGRLSPASGRGSLDAVRG